MFELLKKYCNVINADKEILGEMRKVIDFFIALEENTDLEALPDENHPIYPMYQEVERICKNGFLNADNIIYKDVYYALLFLCYAAIIEKPFKRELILDSLLSLHNGYMSGAEAIGAFANETRSNELLPSINAAIISRLVPDIAEFLAKNSLLPADIPLNQLLVDNDDPGTQKNVYEMLKFYLSDKFTVKEQIEILSALFLDRDCKDRFEKLLKYNKEAARFVVDQVVDNAKLSENLYPIVLKFIKSVNAEEGEDLLVRLTKCEDMKKFKQFLKELFFGKNTSLSLSPEKELTLLQIKVIADALKQNKTLLELDVERQDMGCNGVKYIADALEQNRTLSTLYLGDNNIGPEGAKSVADALKQNRTLSTLYLGDNNIGPEGAKSVADALEQNKTLLTLNLCGNFRIGNEGAKSIADTLKQNNTLSALHLDWSIGDEGVKSIYEALLSSERATKFFCNIFTREQQKQVDNAIANCKRGFADRLKLEREIISDLSRSGGEI